MAINPDAIPTSEQVRETLLDRFYYPFQKQIWAVGVVIALAIISILAMHEVGTRRLNEQWDRYEAAVATGRGASPADPDAQRRGADERITLLQRLVSDFPDDPVTPYAYTAMASAHVDAGRYEDALRVLDDVRTRFKDFPLNTMSADVGQGGKERSLAERLESSIRGEKKWTDETAYVHPQPTSKWLALVETTAGNFWMGFYDELAPRHSANFLALAKSGYFNGTQVYQVRTGGRPEAPTPMVFEAGSEASRYDAGPAFRDPALHDHDEPEATIDPGDARDRIRHLRGVVSAVTMPSGESSHRFMMVCAAEGRRSFDGQNTPFAAVLDREGSLEAIDRICRVPTYGTDPKTAEDPETFRMRDHPYPPVWIRRVSIWKDERLEPGHTWDTSRAGTSDPEPWEETLPAPPLPSDTAPKGDDGDKGDGVKPGDDGDKGDGVKPGDDGEK